MKDMRQYQFEAVSEGFESILHISDGHSFVFEFSASAYKKCREIRTAVYFDNFFHMVSLSPGQLDAQHNIQILLRPREVNMATNGGPRPGKVFDRNVVIKVDRDSPSSFTTYVNGRFISTLESDIVSRNEISCIEMASMRVTPSIQIAVTLTVFDQAERELADDYAEAIRNPETGCLDTEEEEMQAGDGKDAILDDHEREFSAPQIALEEAERKTKEGGNSEPGTKSEWRGWKFFKF